ncbi:PucR family transcriptional regulator [Aneurinibacillus terranovensis]|uniref:PucR family transcriptional regulator n=1 Tax=Aneurinibacillus terranovensis TaxID=278991 RepID=UPI00041D35AA|nr:helix-turn-helix domain-containing protein [Aneurinibacillus terranovensis]
MNRPDSQLNGLVSYMQTLLAAPVTLVTLPLSVAERRAEAEGTAWFVSLPTGENIALKIEAHLTEREKRLVSGIVIQQVRQIGSVVERDHAWLKRALENRRQGIALPPYKVDENSAFNGENVYFPFLINAELPEEAKGFIGAYYERDVLFFSFLSSSGTTSYAGLLVPVSEEEAAGQVEESVEEIIEQWTVGLQLLLEEELGLRLSTAGYYPVASPEDWVLAFMEMAGEYEAYEAFYQSGTASQKMYVPWKYPLEKLLSLLTKEEGRKFIQTYGAEQEALRQFLHDKEGSLTMAAFFEQNLNVSETARHLHIHRNTLQYRLDKIKALTGLDPKRFEEAILAKILLILLEQDTDVQSDQ